MNIENKNKKNKKKKKYNKNIKKKKKFNFMFLDLNILIMKNNNINFKIEEEEKKELSKKLFQNFQKLFQNKKQKKFKIDIIGCGFNYSWILKKSLIIIFYLIFF